MSGTTFAFRCPQCLRLLSARRSRVGATVKCPRCGAALIVPDPEGSEELEPPRSAPVPPPSASEPAPAAGPEPVFPPLVLDEEPFSLRPREADRSYRIPDRNRPASASVAGPGPLASGSPPAAAAGEPARPASLHEPAPRRHDVVLPRSAVLLWSFVMFLALVFAFTAGLLAGHYVWVR